MFRELQSNLTQLRQAPGFVAALFCDGKELRSSFRLVDSTATRSVHLFVFSEFSEGVIRSESFTGNAGFKFGERSNL
jgi:hypothetical protein